MIISHIIFCKYGKQVETSGDRCARVCRIESGSARVVEGFFPINHCFVFIIMCAFTFPFIRFALISFSHVHI